MCSLMYLGEGVVVVVMTVNDSADDLTASPESSAMQNQFDDSQAVEVFSEDRFETILDSIADGVFTVDTQWRITSFNQAAERITGFSRKQAFGKLCCDIFRTEICESNCALRQTLETGTPVINKAVYIVDRQGNQLPISISTALLKDSDGQVIGGAETFRDLTLVEELRKEVTGKYTFADIISKNHRMQELFHLLPQIAECDSTILIEGESGTGKELFARAIHSLSGRSEKPFVAVNCGALPDTLLESELFGYKAGAFTDARKDKPGRFALAEGGTIFLDEIGDVSPALQIRLLRVLQEKTYEPLGAMESMRADVRVLAATNKCLADLVKAGSFRDDLYYRVNVVRLLLPPLRDRKEDIPLLIDSIIDRFNRLRGKDITGLSTETMTILLGHDYPGNIRELENIIEHAFILCPGGMIETAHLPDNLRPDPPSGGTVASTLTTLEQMERRLIEEALKQNRGNRASAAKSLGIHKSTLFRKVKSLGIELPEKDGRSTRHT